MIQNCHEAAWFEIPDRQEFNYRVDGSFGSITFCMGNYKKGIDNSVIRYSPRRIVRLSSRRSLRCSPPLFKSYSLYINHDLF